MQGEKNAGQTPYKAILSWIKNWMNASKKNNQ